MPTWLTADEIARQIGRPVSTVRSWRDRYRAFVPEQRDRQGRQTYPLERMVEIAAMRAQNLTPREINAELERRRVGLAGVAGAPVTLEMLVEDLRAIREDVRWLVEREKAREP